MVLCGLDIADKDGAFAVDGLDDALDVLLEGAVLSLHFIIFYKWNLAIVMMSRCEPPS